MDSIYKIISDLGHNYGAIKAKLLNNNLLNTIYFVTKFLDEKYSGISIGQRIWHIRNKNLSIQTCIANSCNNVARWVRKGGKERHGYGYCSDECSRKYGIKNARKTFGIKYKNLNDILKKSRITSLKKYGTDNPSKSKIVKDKIIKSLNKKKKEFRKRSIEMMIEKNKDLYQKSGYILLDYLKNGMVSLKHEKCGDTFEMKNSTVHARGRYNTEICSICNPIGNHFSFHEKKIYDFIISIYKNTILCNTRKKIYPFELDIYLPDLKFGIEFNGDYWHANPKLYSSEDIIWKTTAKNIWDRDDNKKKMCKIKNIDLIIIWESEWVNDNKRIKEMIYNKIINNGTSKCII